MDKREYTRRVVSVMRHLTAAEITAIREELEAHIEDRMEPLLGLEGVDEAEAERRSIAAMGDPETVGWELQKQYARFWLWLERALRVLLVLLVCSAALSGGSAVYRASLNVQADQSPLSRMAQTTRKTVDQTLRIKQEIGSDVLHIYATGRKEGEVVVFYCRYDQSVFGYLSGWGVTFEDCRGQELPGGDGYHSISGTVAYHSHYLQVPWGDPYVTAVVERYGERTEIQVPLLWEEAVE